MSDLKDQLQTIDGVGEATADKILEVIEEHNEMPEDVFNAYTHAENGNARMAASYLSQVVDDE